MGKKRNSISIREWRNGTSFGLNDLEALLTVARGQGVDDRSCLEALNRFTGKPPALRGLPLISKDCFVGAQEKGTGYFVWSELGSASIFKAWIDGKWVNNLC